MNNKLKPCPFCGGEAHIIQDINHKTMYVACSKCRASGRMGTYSTRQIVGIRPGTIMNKDIDALKNIIVESWNRRTKK